MRKCMTLALLAALAGGCATSKTTAVPGAAPPQKPQSAGFMERFSGSKKLKQAQDLLEKGDAAGAAKALGQVVSGKAVPGVTDEALFRLALLSIKPGAERPGAAYAGQLLRRLKKEYPASPWTVQAAPLMELLSAVDEAKQQNRSLKANNQALAREIAELNAVIRQLKNLDLELEQKGR